MRVQILLPALVLAFGAIGLAPAPCAANWMGGRNDHLQATQRGKDAKIKNRLSDLNDQLFAKLDDKVRKGPNG